MPTKPVTKPGSLQCMIWFGALWCLSCALLYPTAKKTFTRDVSCDIVAKRFPKDYWKARAAFRESATNASAALSALEMGADVGPGNLTIDVAFLPGSQPEHVLLHISGTHGVEGFAGSAIQAKFLQDVAAGATKPGPSVLLVHALNPFGFERLRRQNEGGVDLGRNLLDDAGFAAAAKADSSNYDALDAFINPKTVSKFDFFWPKAAFYLATRGVTNLKAAFGSGQWHHKAGLFFGGDKVARSHALLKDFLAKHPAVAGAKKLAVVDVQTGLGPWKLDTLTVDGDGQLELLRKAGLDEGLEASRIESAAAAGSTTAAAGYPALFGGAAEKLAITQKFGTVHMAQVFRHLRHENAVFHHGDEEERERPKMALRDAFNPSGKCDWQTAVLARGVGMLGQLNNHLA
jgi:hypothetical protein